MELWIILILATVCLVLVVSLCEIYKKSHYERDAKDHYYSEMTNARKELDEYKYIETKIEMEKLAEGGGPS